MYASLSWDLGEGGTCQYRGSSLEVFSCVYILKNNVLRLEDQVNS